MQALKPIVAAYRFSSFGVWVLGSMGFSSCGTWAYLPRGMWDLPEPGIKLLSPALPDRLLVAVPSRKFHFDRLFAYFNSLIVGTSISSENFTPFYTRRKCDSLKLSKNRNSFKFCSHCELFFFFFNWGQGTFFSSALCRFPFPRLLTAF